MSLLLKLFLLIVGTNIFESSYGCITDCTYQYKSKLMPEAGYYCVTNEFEEGYTPGGEDLGKWGKKIRCTQDRPIIGSTAEPSPLENPQVPYLFHYRSDTGYICNGRCAKWFKEVNDWCLDDQYVRSEMCDSKYRIYDADNFWPNLHSHLEDTLKTYEDYKKQLSFSPKYLGIEENYNRIAVGPIEFYKQDKMDINDPVHKYITVYSPGSESYAPKELTVAMSARIYPRHIREIDMCPAKDKTVDCCYSFVPKEDDEAQVLLKYTLGGSINSKNIIPLAAYLKTDATGKVTFNEDLAFLGAVEKVAHKFLKSNPTGYVDWTALVHYGELYDSCRPRAIFYKMVFKTSDITGDRPYYFKDGLMKGHYQIEFIVNNDNPKYSADWKDTNFN